MNGVPRLESSIAQKWVTTVDREFKEFIHRIHHNHRDVIDEYGATNPAEFFAVTTETFFEKPDRLAREHPELYAMFQEFYRVDPREWE